MIFVIVLYALFASVFTISKEALCHAQPLFLVGTRMAAAGLLLLGWQWFRGGIRMDRRSWGHIALLALCAIYVTNALEFWAMQRLASSTVCLIYSLSPFAAALLSRERLSGKKWLGLTVGVAGMLPLMCSGGGEWGFSWPELAVAGAAVASVYGWIVLKKLVEGGCVPMVANGWAMLLGGILALLHSGAVETWNPVPVSNVEAMIGCTAVLMVISNGICYNLYGCLLKKLSATFMSLAGLMTPLFAGLFGYLAFGEQPGWGFYGALCAVGAGMLLFYREELAIRVAHE